MRDSPVSPLSVISLFLASGILSMASSVSIPPNGPRTPIRPLSASFVIYKIKAAVVATLLFSRRRRLSSKRGHSISIRKRNTATPLLIPSSVISNDGNAHTDPVWASETQHFRHARTHTLPFRLHFIHPPRPPLPVSYDKKGAANNKHPLSYHIPIKIPSPPSTPVPHVPAAGKDSRSNLLALSPPQNTRSPRHE